MGDGGESHGRRNIPPSPLRSQSKLNLNQVDYSNSVFSHWESTGDDSRFMLLPFTVEVKIKPSVRDMKVEPLVRRYFHTSHQGSSRAHLPLVVLFSERLVVFECFALFTQEISKEMITVKPMNGSCLV